MKVKLKQRENRLHKNPQNGHKSARGPHRRDVTHILSKVSGFLLKSFHFRRLRKRCFFPIQILIFLEYYATMPMLADAHISSLGYLWRLFNETQQNFFLFVLFPVHEVHYPFRDLLVYPGAPGLSHHAITSIIVIKRHSASPGELLASHIMKNACRACVIDIKTGGPSCRAQLFNN